MAKAALSSFVLFLFFFFAPPFSFSQKPCSKPLDYAIGSIDSRFGLSSVNLLKAIEEAESLWERALGFDLFELSEQGDLSIDLVYDYRQEATIELTAIEGEVKEDESLYRSIERDYLALKDDHASLKKVYDAKAEMFKKKSAEYDAKVEVWNDGNRTSKQEFQALERDRQALEADLAELRLIEGDVNSMVIRINTMVARLNSLAESLDLGVDRYNSIGASRGETFTGGAYYSDEEGRRIEIYEFKDHAKLVRVLAHELGHALGLEHVEEEGAIMYRLNEGEAVKLARADIEALKALCGVE